MQSDFMWWMLCAYVSLGAYTTVEDMPTSLTPFKILRILKQTPDDNQTMIAHPYRVPVLSRSHTNGSIRFDWTIEQRNPGATLWWQKELQGYESCNTLPISIPQEFRQKFPPVASPHRVPVLLLYFISGGYSTSFLNGSPPGGVFTFVTEGFLALS